MIPRPLIRPASYFVHNPTGLRQFKFTAPLRGTMSAAVSDIDASQAANTSGITPDSLERLLTEKLDAEHVKIEDMSGANSHAACDATELTNCIGGCGQAFQAIIVSPQFDKKTQLARHRLVNAALKEEIAAIHAWSPKCYTPDQWGKIKSEKGL